MFAFPLENEAFEAWRGGEERTAEFALRLRSVWVSKMYAFPLKNEALEAGRRALTAGFGLRLRPVWVSNMYAFPLKN